MSAQGMDRETVLRVRLGGDCIIDGFPGAVLGEDAGYASVSLYESRLLVGYRITFAKLADNDLPSRQPRSVSHWGMFE